MENCFKNSSLGTVLRLKTFESKTAKIRIGIIYKVQVFRLSRLDQKSVLSSIYKVKVFHIFDIKFYNKESNSYTVFREGVYTINLPAKKIC